MSEASKSFVERILAGFFGGWTASDKLAFLYFMAGLGLVMANRIDAKELMSFAWGFLAGRSEMMGYGSMGYGTTYPAMQRQMVDTEGMNTDGVDP